jgi:hypothetical protein
MNKVWMPITAGVLDILNGIFGIFEGVFILAWVTVGLWGTVFENYKVWVPLLIIAGLLAIAGSVFALKRKIWPLAMAGAIIALIPTVPGMYDFWEGFNTSYFFSLPTIQGFIAVPAIVAIILTILSRKQFERK